jgi:hypothetical protein
MDSQWIQINSPKAKQNKIKTHTYTIYGLLIYAFKFQIQTKDSRLGQNTRGKLG